MAGRNAIAAASRTLRRLLLDRMEATVTVTIAPPDVQVSGVGEQRINLYPFQVLEHAQLRNQGIPGHDHPGAPGPPPLSLTLRYLLTTHARSEDQPDSDLIAQALLGDAMMTLHRFGAGVERLTLVTGRAGTIGDPMVDDGLAAEFERVHAVLAPIPVDEIARLWSAMPQANLRRSVVYDVSVLQIEDAVPRAQAQPVAERRIYAGMPRVPELLAAYAVPAPGTPQRDARVAVGDLLTIEHRPLAAERLYVRLGELEPIRVALPSTGVLTLAVPDDAYPVDPDHAVILPIPAAARLRPGPLAVTLVAEQAGEGVGGGVDRGLPIAAPRRSPSNTLFVQLVPEVTGHDATGSASGGDVLTVTGTRLWDGPGSAAVMVGDAAVPVVAPGPGDGWPTPATTAVAVPVAAVAALLAPRAAPYPLAVQVNGARSRPAGGFTLTP